MGRERGQFAHLDFVLIDLCCLAVSFIAAFLGYHLIKNGEWITFDAYNGAYRLMVVLIAFSHLFYSLAGNEYSGILRRNTVDEARVIVWHNIKVLATILITLFFLKNSAVYSRLILFSTFALNTVLCFIFRIIHKKVLLRSSPEKGISNRRLLIITDASDVDSLRNSLAPKGYSRYTIAGVCNSESYRDFVKDNVVDEAFISIDEGDVRNSVTETLIDMGMVIHIDLGQYMESMPNSVMENLNERSVITAGINPMTFRQRFVKRTIDILGSIIGLVLMVLAFLIFAPIIFLQSPGPVLFKQKRVGKNGRIFDFYKFRSMYPDAEARKAELMKENKMQGLMFKMDNDPRIIPIGHFLRKSSIDELPQFWNVLKGDMSLVGTRPPTLDEYEKYSLYHASRLSIKPGITGLWQISGRSDITDFEEVVRLDREYIRNFSTFEDLRILFKTIWVVIGRKGSV